MPRRRKPAEDLPESPIPITDELLNKFAPDGILTAEQVESASRRFKKALLERALGAELSHHLGYQPGDEKPLGVTNHRNGTSGKTVLTDDGAVAIEVPRDREGTFEPQLIGKHERRFAGFDDKIIALYARGLTVREIQAFLREMYRVDVSPDLISAVTDAVVAEVTEWQARPLEPMYPVVLLRRAARQDPRRGRGPQQGGVPGGSGAAGRHPRHSRHLDRADRRREVLAEGLQ
jgi:transposase-like protein